MNTIEPALHKANCFLSLPHEFETLRKELTTLVQRVGGQAFYVTESEGQRLRTEIAGGLANSSILIADLSSAPQQPKKPCFGPRPAIMWEIGYAEASGMSGIYLCQKKDRAVNVPSIIAEEHLIEYDLNKLDAALQRVERALEKIIARGPSSGRSVFRADCYVDRRSCDLEVKYLGANKTVRILELNLDSVRDQVNTIIRALTRNPNLSVQILTLNPFSEFAAARADQLAELPFSYRRLLIDTMQATHSALGEIASNRWELRVYDTFPTQIMFQIDESIFHSIISLGRRSRDMLHFEVQRGQPNAQTSFEAHFATLWNRSVEYKRWLQENEAGVREVLQNASGVSKSTSASAGP